MNDFLLSAVPHTQYNYTVVAETSFGRGDNVSSLSFSSMQAGENSNKAQNCNLYRHDICKQGERELL